MSARYDRFGGIRDWEVEFQPGRPPTILPASVERRWLDEVTKLGDRFRSFVDRRTGRRWDGEECARLAGYTVAPPRERTLHLTQYGGDAIAARAPEAADAAATDKLKQLHAEAERLQAIVDGIEWAVGLAVENTHELNVTRMMDFLYGEVPKEAMVCEAAPDPSPWIPFHERQPEPGLYQVIYRGDTDIAGWDGSHWSLPLWQGYPSVGMGEVTHWAPLLGWRGE